MDKAETFMWLLFRAIEHGDEEHREWLQDKVLEWTPTLRLLLQK